MGLYFKIIYHSCIIVTNYVGLCLCMGGGGGGVWFVVSSTIYDITCTVLYKYTCN